MFAAVAALLLAVLGAVAWSALATWNAAREELDAFARVVDDRSVRVRLEGMRLSGQLGDDLDCDRILLRRLVSGAHYVRDIGRIRGNHIYCNAPDGAGAHIDLGEPQIVRADGVRMWVSPRNIYAARGNSFLRMDPMSFVDLTTPDDVIIAVLELESGRLLTHSGHLPKSLLQEATRHEGRFQFEGFLATSSRSIDGRTLDLAVRPVDSVEAAVRAGMPRAITVGGLVGLVLALLVLVGFGRHHSLMSELRRAVRHRDLRGDLQPIVEVIDGQARVVGFECLARWLRPDGSEISPSKFVPMIETAGLGSELARCMVASLVTDFGATLRANPDLYVSLNLASADVADSRLLDDLDRMLSAAGIPTGQIVIELTERTFEAEGLAGGLERLRQAGHRLSIDDFGTGASNASRLASFHPEMVKVDRSFLLHADTDSHASALLPQLVAMAHGCGAKVVVEGVETLSQAERLAGFGDVYAQGYFWHRPMSAAEAAQLVTAQRAAEAVLAAAPVSPTGALA